MIITIDLDGTLCEEVHYTHHKFAPPIPNCIARINAAYNSGDTIIIFTSRWKNEKKLTEDWLKENGVKYNDLIMGKPLADLYVDEKARRPDEIWKT